MSRRIPLLAIAVSLFLLTSSEALAGDISRSLQQKLTTVSDAAPVGTVIVVFNAPQGLQSSHLGVLQNLGITGGKTLPNLGMVAVAATAAQVKSLATQDSVLSVWSNDPLYYLDKETNTLTGVEKARNDAAFTALNGGLPVSGLARNPLAIVINDSGIDGTHADTHYPEHVIQNVQTSSQDDVTGMGFAPFIYQEGVPNTDTAGHGTHCAGIAAGTGAQSGGLYAGVAPGANLIGVGSGAALFVLNALGGFEYSLANQYRYNIRVISNSFGPGGNPPYVASDPINVASKMAHDHGMVVTFAGGNDGPVTGVFNPYASAPWVIGVAAGTKEGGLASFSSRGLPKSQRDPSYNYAPTLTAPGTGREFASNAGRFSSAVVSVKSKTATSEQGLTADTELAPSYLPFYTQISGTSMATPFVAGSAALLLSIDPTLSPDQIKSILVQTATQMPGFHEYEVGAGYINVYAAIDKTFHRNKAYGTYGGAIDTQVFNARYTVSGPPAASFHIDYNPALASGNMTTFQVGNGMNVLDILATVNDTTGQVGNNLVGLVATDPNGKTYSSGIQLPVIGSNAREVKVTFPVAGTWTLRVGGVTGLTAAPVRSPIAAALPGPVDGTITQQTFNLQPVSDIQGSPVQSQIEDALTNRLMDIDSSGLFHPNAQVTVGDFARLMVTNSALRQSLANSAQFADVSGSMEAIAEAVTSSGPSLRDYAFDSTGLIAPANSGTLGATSWLSRLNIAVGLVKLLGEDAAAQGAVGVPVTASYNGQSIKLDDDSNIPSALKGYVQLALNRGLLQAYFSFVQGPYDLQPTLHAKFLPGLPVTRSMMAVSLLNTRKAFIAGN